MPSKPPQMRRAGQLTRHQQRRRYDEQRDEQPWRRWYKTARWQNIRAHQLATEPLCATCLADGRITAATVCDHVERHEGVVDRFWAGPFQSLCAHCHNAVKQREERAAAL